MRLFENLLKNNLKYWLLQSPGGIQGYYSSIDI